jgi:hypothetical protein
MAHPDSALSIRQPTVTSAPRWRRRETQMQIGVGSCLHCMLRHRVRCHESSSSGSVSSGGDVEMAVAAMRNTCVLQSNMQSCNRS